MPTVFQYASPVNPYAASIGEIILHGGDIRARQAEAVAAANARAAMASGDAWSRAFANIGATTANAFQQATDPQRKLEALALKNAEDVRAGQQVMDRAMTPTVPNGPQPDGEAPAAAQHPYLDDQGLADPTKITQLLQANGMGHLAPELLKGVEAQNQSILSYKQHQQEAATKQAVMLGSVANTTLALMDTGMPFSQAAQHASSPLIATGVMDPKIVQQQIAALSQLPPDQLTAHLQQLKAAAEQLGPKETLKEGEVQKGMFGTTLAANPKVEKPTEAEIALRAAGGDPTKAMALLKPPPPATSQEWKDVLLDGKPAKVFVDPKTRVVTTLGGQVVDNADQRIKPVPTQASVTVNQNESDAKAIADAIISGDQPPDVKGLFRLAGPVRAELAKQGYDMTKANLDWEATKKHLATLNGAQQTRLRQSISTASDSLGVIEDLAQQWDGGKFPILNKANLALAVNGVLGPKAQQIATNLQAQITDVTSELGNVYMGGNSPTDHALGLAQKNLSADWTKDQLLSAIKLARTNLQIRQNSITNSGAVLSGGSAAPPAPPAGGDRVRVKGPNGQTGTVPKGTALPAGWSLQ